jgi:hypothetical protein
VKVNIEQTRSLVALPGVDSTVVVLHDVHAVQVCAFVVALNVLALHAVHILSAVVVPAASTRVPGLHVLHVVQLGAFVAML